MHRLLTVVLLTGGVLGYNFEDPYFNDLLLDNLRFHRGRPAVVGDSSQANLKLGDMLTYRCCDYLNKDNFHQLELTQIVCYVETALLSDNNTRTGRSTLLDSIDSVMKEQFICAAECVARKEQIADDSGNLLGSDVLIPFVTQYYADGIYSSDQISDFVNQCSTSETETDQATSKCNSAAADFGYCMWKKTQLNCPAERQDTNPACDNLRDKLMSSVAERVIA